MKKHLLSLLLAAMMASALPARAQTAGCLVVNFPRTENCDAQNALPSCWNTAGSTFQMYLSFNHAGPNQGWSIKVSGPEPCMLVLPRMDAPLNELTLTFWSYKDDPWGFYTGTIQVGYCTDSSNASTFVMVQSITQASASVWESFTVDFSTLPETANGRLAFFKPQGNSGLYLDDFTVSRVSPCGDAVQLEVPSVGRHVAAVRWQNSLGAEGDYVVRYRTVPGTQWDSLAVAQTHAFLSNLLADTNYEVSVRSDCPGEESSFCVPVTFRTAACGSAVAGAVDSVSDNGHSVEFPVNAYQNYSYAQMLYPATSLATLGADSIRALSLFNQSNYVLDDRTMQIRVMLTDREGFESYYDQEPWDLMQPVFSGTVAMHHGWITIPLDQPFYYDGMSNLVVALFDNTNQMSFFTVPWWSVSNVGGATAYASSADASTVDQLSWVFGSVDPRTPVMRFTTMCDPTDGCLPPVVMVMDSDPNSVEFAIHGGASETMWEASYRALGESEWGELGSVTDGFVLGGLDPGTTYQVRFSTLCDDNSARSTLVRVTTVCGAVAPPFRQNFDLLEEYSTAINCWTLAMGTGYALPMVETPWGGSSQSLKLDGGTYVVLPEIDDQYPLSLLSLRLSLIGNEPDEWTSSTDGVVVGVMSDPADISTFLPLQTLTTATSTPQTCEVSFAALDTMDFDGRYIALQGLATTGWEGVHVDDLLLRVTPECPAPEALTLVSVTTNSATLSWRGQSANYLVEYGPTGMTMGSGTFVSVADTFAVVSSLQAGTRYDFYVYGLCTDTSFEAGPLTVQTECGAITLPYVNNFETELVSGTGATGVMPLCWTNLGGNSGVYYDQYMYEGVTFSGGKALYVGAGATVALPMVGGLTPNQVQVDLMALTDGASARLLVGVCDGLSSTGFTAVDTIEVASWEYNHATSYLFPYQGQGQYLALRALDGKVYIDDLQLTEAPTCFPVANLQLTSTTETSVSVAWSEVGPASQWEVSCSTSPAEPASGTLVSTPSHTFASLNPGEINYVYVRSYCSATDQGVWVGPLTVAANSWAMRANQWDTLSICSGVIFDDGGANAPYSGNQTSVLVIRPTLENRPAEIRLIGTGVTNTYPYSVCDYLRIYDGPDTTARLVRHTGYSSTVNFDVTLHSGVATILFVADEWSEDEGFQIQVECLPVSCPMVSDITTTSTENSITASWTSNGSESLWLVDCNGTTYTANTTSFTIPGLAPSSSYEIAVRPLCSATDTGLALSTYASTLCGIVPLTADHPFFESFESETMPVNSCWTVTYGDALNIPTHSSVQALHGERSFRFSSLYEVGDYNEYLITPPFSCGEAIEASFSYRTEEEYAETLIVGYSTTTADPASEGWVWIDTVEDGMNSQWKRYTATLPAEAVYFGIHYANTRDNYYVYIDSLLLTTEFTGCVSPQLEEPVMMGYDSALLSWTGLGTEYQLQYKTATDNAWSAFIPVEGDSHLLSGLLAGVEYQYRVRMVCSGDAFSPWSLGSFTTPVLPCYTPTAFQITDFSGTYAHFSWTPAADETLWQLRLWNSVFDSMLTLSQPQAQWQGLLSEVGYHAAVRSVCGNGAAFSSWSDTLDFTTLACAPVSNLQSSFPAPATVALSWTPGADETQWILFYSTSTSVLSGMEQMVLSSPSATLSIPATGATMLYGYVRAVCGDDWVSHDLYFELPLPVGIDDVETGRGLALDFYPNPSTGLLQVVTSMETPCLLEVIDLAGRRLVSQTLSAASTTLDLSALPAGAYFLKVGTQVKRLVIQ